MKFKSELIRADNRYIYTNLEANFLKIVAQEPDLTKRADLFYM